LNAMHGNADPRRATAPIGYGRNHLILVIAVITLPS